MSEGLLTLKGLAKDWNKDSLSNITIFIKDGTHGTHERVEKGIPLLSASNITASGKILWDSDVSRITDQDFEKIHSKYSLQKNDLLITVVGTLGRSALISDSRKFTLQRSVGIIRTNEAKVLPIFLYHFTNGHFFQNQLILRSNATAQAGVYLGELGKIEVPIPPLPEQQKIAQILTSVDEVIEKTEAQIHKLQDLKKGMMNELLTKGIGHTEFKDSPVGRIPVEWDFQLLDKISKRGSGHTPDKKKPEYWNGAIKWVSLADSFRLDKIYISETDKEISKLGLQNSSAVLHPKGTVIISRDAGIGKSAILREEMAVSQHFIAWNCGENLDNLFFYYLLQQWKPKFEAIAIGSTIKTIGLSYFKKIQIPLPPFPEQQKIASILTSIDTNIEKKQAKLNQTKNLKKSMMADLLTGRVRVKLN